MNSAGTPAYDAPCPVGHAHTYRFTVYALSSEIDLAAGASLQQVMDRDRRRHNRTRAKSRYWVPVIMLIHVVTSSYREILQSCDTLPSW